MSGPAWAQAASPAAGTAALEPAFIGGHRRLVVIRLLGGNDNLNTLVPYKDPLYRQYRPDIGLPARRLIPLTDELAFNDALKGLADVYDAGEVAVIQEVGKPGQNLSHFVSGDTWSMAASPTENSLHQGWIGHAFVDNPAVLQADFDAHGIVFGIDGMSMSAPHVRSLQVQDIPGLRALGAEQSARVVAPTEAPAAHHLAELLNMSAMAAQQVGGKLTGANRFIHYFASDNVLSAEQRQVALMLWMIERGVTSPAFQIDITGFDMHSHLPGAHEERLQAFAAVVQALRVNLKSMGAWDDTLLLVHSEFGRRAAQNASMGTDHGSAAPSFFIGGRVHGGLVGSRSDLAQLDVNGNIAYGIDYRRLYSTVLSSFWRLPANPFATAGHAPLDGIWA